MHRLRLNVSTLDKRVFEDATPLRHLHADNDKNKASRLHTWTATNHMQNLTERGYLKQTKKSTACVSSKSDKTAEAISQRTGYSQIITGKIKVRIQVER